MRQWGRWAFNTYLYLKDRIKLSWLKVTGRPLVLSWINRADLIGDKFVIFATFPSRRPPACHRRLLRQFEARGYRILLVSNNRGAIDLIGDAFDPHWTYLFRRPFGRDFGCYRDACLALHEYSKATGQAIRRVVLLNDSIITFPKSEAELVVHLDRETSEFSGLTENFEIGYHVGSFALAMGERAFAHPDVVRFWESYIPISSRLHSISRGEMGLTATLCRAGFAPDIFHDLTSMKERLDRMELRDMRQLTRTLPPRFDMENLALLEDIDRYLDSPCAADGGSAKSLDLRDVATHAILSFIFRASPAHLGAALLASGKGAMLKKDVVWRLVIQPWQLKDLIRNADPGASPVEQEDVRREIMSRGHPHTLGTWQRILYEWAIL